MASVKSVVMYYARIMPKLVLQATADHVRRIASDSNPTQAIIELIWNGLDAEADQVFVIYKRDPSLRGITDVVVYDTGHGITPEEVSNEFGRLGDSWKRHGDRRSKNGKRRVHGSKGLGRLRAFALGSYIQWESTSRDTAGDLKTIRVEGQASTRNVFTWEVLPSPEASEPGTKFTAFNPQKPSLNSLDTEASRELIASAFAPALLDDQNLTITIDDVPLDPRSQIDYDTLYKEQVEPSEGQKIDVQVRIIEWKGGTHRQIYFSELPGLATQVEDGRSIEGQYAYSAYISWPGLEANSDLIGLGGMAPDPVGKLILAGFSIIRKHFNERRRQRRRQQIEIWKEQGIYPYEGEPADEAERIERTLFDLVSGTISGQVARERLEAGLTLRLLKNVLNTQPGELISILNEIISLTPSERSSLTELLATTPLSNLVKAGSLVKARQHFLTALDHLIYDPTDSRFVGERRNLHPMLEQELWLFGEEYMLMSSERGLTEMLRNHLRLSGLPAVVGESVKTWDGKTGRTDLHLAAVRREHDRNRHLIVELKAPSVEITHTEVGQVRRYGDVLFEDARFHSGSSSWDLILVGGKISNSVRRDILDPATGMFWRYEGDTSHEPKVAAFVRSWRDVIDENLRRLSFFTAAMEQDPSLSESIAALRERYAELLPDMLRGEDEDSRPR